MCLVNSHSLWAQDYASVLSRGQEHSPELSIALDPLEESEFSTF